MSNKLEKLQKNIISFRDERDWKQFHNPKDLAISIALESSELLEHFQWKNRREVEKYTAEHKDQIAEEMADIFIYLLTLAYDTDIDLLKSSAKKLEKNNQKYSVEKSKSNHKKYTEL